MVTTAFEQNMIDLVKSFFPKSEWLDQMDIDEALINFGISYISEKSDPVDTYDFYRKFEAIDDIVIDRLTYEIKQLRFMKEPRFVYWRTAGYEKEKNFEKEVDVHKSWARFTLGY